MHFAYFYICLKLSILLTHLINVQIPVVLPVLSLTKIITYHSCKNPLSTESIDSRIVSVDSQYHKYHLPL